MLTEKQLKIFEPLTKNMVKEYTIQEIKLQSMEKSNNSLSLALKKFKGENLVKEKRIGRSLLYSLNIENEAVFSYVEILNNKKIQKIVKRAIDRIKEEVEKHTSFFSMAIFGSYSTGDQTVKSDLDVSIFIGDERNKKLIEGALKISELKTPLEIHGHVLTEKEFLEMLKADNENLGKQIARKHLSIYNSCIFYSILKKGIKNGFNL